MSQQIQERRLMSVRSVVLSLVLALVASSAGFAGVAQAVPAWDLYGHHAPTVFRAGEVAQYSFDLSNVGDATVSGPVTMEIELPAGVTTRLANADPSGTLGPVTTYPTRWYTGWEVCPSTPGASSTSCVFTGPTVPGGGSQYPGRLVVFVDVAPGATGPLTATAVATAAGVPPVTVSETAQVGTQDPGFGFVNGLFAADAFDRAGVAERQAGAHPYRASAAFDLNQMTLMAPDAGDTSPGAPLHPWIKPVGTPRNIDITLPRGFVGNPLAVEQCPPALLLEAKDIGTECPVSTQVGTVDFSLRSPQGPGTPPLSTHAPVYNVVPPDGALASLGFQALNNPVYIIASLDPRDNSIVTKIHGINERYALFHQKLTLWGVPGDPVHDPDRWNPKGGNLCSIAPVFCGAWGSSSPLAVKPFLTLPSQCGVSDTSDVTWLSSWQDPAVNALGAGPARSAPAQVKGCERQTFSPSVSLTPDAIGPDSPTGLKVDIELPQDDEPNGLGTPPLRDAKVVLPEGMSINPAAADGLDACTDDQLRLGTDLGLKLGEPSCPEASKVGTVTAVSPALEEPIEGSVYIRSQNSDDPQSGEMFRMALVLKHEERGLLVKLPGSVKADPVTGRLTAEFQDNPQLPVSKISVRLKGGARAPLATPPTCGVKTFDATLSAWGGQVSQLTDSFTVPCPAFGGFSPTMTAGSLSPVAGAFSPFAVQIDRPDGEQFIDGVSLDLPTGVLAKLRGVPVCADAQAAAGICPAGSRVGTATVGAGSGTPFVLNDQPVYLAGPYKGAPYSLSVATRAKAGPFDLGVVVVRQALHVDPIDAHVTVNSDPLPTIVKGVPLRLRSIDVTVDRPGFTINPTSCAPKVVTGALYSVAGQTATVSARFQASECTALDLKPTLALSLSGKGQTTDGKHPAVTADVTQQPGQANLKKVRVALPLSLALDQDNANGLCEFVDGSKVTPTCPKSSIVGTATAVTPILDQPLTGPVYFVKNIRKDPKSGREIRTLPKLVIPLTGQNGLKLTLTGTSAVEDDRLVTTFDTIPDAPVSSFKLSIVGGKGGILAISGDKADICKSTQIADQQIDGHNGKQADADISIQTPSCPLKVISKKVAKTSVAIKIGGLGAGKVTVAGKGIKKTTKTISKSTVATITAKRIKGKPGKVTVSYDPTGPAKARKTTK